MTSVFVIFLFPHHQLFHVQVLCSLVQVVLLLVWKILQNLCVFKNQHSDGNNYSRVRKDGTDICRTLQ